MYIQHVTDAVRFIFQITGQSNFALRKLSVPVFFSPKENIKQKKIRNFSIVRLVSKNITPSSCRAFDWKLENSCAPAPALSENLEKLLIAPYF